MKRMASASAKFNRKGNYLAISRLAIYEFQFSDFAISDLRKSFTSTTSGVYHALYVCVCVCVCVCACH